LVQVPIADAPAFVQCCLEHAARLTLLTVILRGANSSPALKLNVFNPGQFVPMLHLRVALPSAPVFTTKPFRHTRQGSVLESAETVMSCKHFV
jgi:hypothetical protein